MCRARPDHRAEWNHRSSSDIPWEPVRLCRARSAPFPIRPPDGPRQHRAVLVPEPCFFLDHRFPDESGRLRRQTQRHRYHTEVSNVLSLPSGFVCFVGALPVMPEGAFVFERPDLHSREYPQGGSGEPDGFDCPLVRLPRQGKRQAGGCGSPKGTARPCESAWVLT